MGWPSTCKQRLQLEQFPKWKGLKMNTEQSRNTCQLNELSVGGEQALVTPEVLAAAGGSPAVFCPDTPVRQLFEDWVTRHAPIAEFIRNEHGEYIVLGMQDEYSAFVAGWAARSH
jgi:hypothetical protein